MEYLVLIVLIICVTVYCVVERISENLETKNKTWVDTLKDLDNE